jgi:hypothetical protein
LNLRSLLCSTLFWSRHFPSLGVFTRPSTESSSSDSLLRSSSFDPLLKSFSLDPRGSTLLDSLLQSSTLSQSELLPTLGQLCLCPGCVLFCLSRLGLVYSLPTANCSVLPPHLTPPPHPSLNIVTSSSFCSFQPLQC